MKNSNCYVIEHGRMEGAIDKIEFYLHCILFTSSYVALKAFISFKLLSYGYQEVVVWLDIHGVVFGVCCVMVNHDGVS